MKKSLTLLVFSAMVLALTIYSTRFLLNTVSNTSNQIIIRKKRDAKNESEKPLIQNFNVVGFRTKELNERISFYFTKLVKSTDGTTWIGTSKGLYKSINEKNFENVESGLPANEGINNIIISPLKLNKLMYVNTSNEGWHISKDNGNTFKKITWLNDGSGFSDFMITKNGEIFATCNKQENGQIIRRSLYKSIDGENFEKIFSKENSGLIQVIEGPDGTIYLAFDGEKTSNFMVSELWKSIDADHKQFSLIKSFQESISAILVTKNNKIIISVSFWWRQAEDYNKAMFYISKNNGKTFEKKISSTISSCWEAQNLKEITSDTIIVWGNHSIYVSNDNLENFEKIDRIPPLTGGSAIGNDDSNLYISSGTGEEAQIYKLDFNHSFINYKNPDYIGNKFNGFVYNQEQEIDIKADYLTSATLNGKLITIPYSKFKLTPGIHKLVVTVKEQYRKYLGLFGDNAKTGKITYNFWIEPFKDIKNEIKYEVNINDTELLVGLISNKGNTNGKPIIQTKTNSAISHPAKLTINLNIDLFDLTQSYYVKGKIDNNNFKEEEQKKTITNKLTTINDDGIYKFHLVDFVGNNYESYLELGKNNWIITGIFENSDLQAWAEKLNVTISVASEKEKQQALVWLQNYQVAVNQVFNEALQDKGKGFIFQIAELPEKYKSFTNPINYGGPKQDYKINSEKLKQQIENIANKYLEDGINQLPKNLNVDTRNVIDKTTLDSCKIWTNNYQRVINQNENKWKKEIATSISREFATSNEMQVLENYLTEKFKYENINNYLTEVIWKSDFKFNDFQKYIQFEKLKNEASEWVNKQIPQINERYQNKLKEAKSDINLHRYSLKEILDNQNEPQKQSEFANFANSGQSFHNWLQTQADLKFKTYQIRMGLGIGLPVGAGILCTGIFLYWRYSGKWHPYGTLKNYIKDLKNNK